MFFEKAVSHFVYQNHAATTNAVQTCREFNAVSKPKNSDKFIEQKLKSERCNFCRSQLAPYEQGLAKLGNLKNVKPGTDDD